MKSGTRYAEHLSNSICDLELPSGFDSGLTSGLCVWAQLIEKAASNSTHNSFLFDFIFFVFCLFLILAQQLFYDWSRRKATSRI